MSYFLTYYNSIRYPISTDNQCKGLRNAQLGAIHAIAAHFTLYNDEPALVVMPTGSGKTAVLNLSPYLLKSNRVLVISSSVLVRGQIVDEFSTLKTLKDLNVFKPKLQKPKVKEIKSPIRTSEMWESLKEFDVVIGIPNSINEGIKDDITPPIDLFDLILVDEAHHVPAFTWSNIIKTFNKSKKIYFTATPFRRDKKEVEGRLVYNYPLEKAYEDKIFGDLAFYPVITNNPNIDLAIAKDTEKIFFNDKNNGFEHFIMVRTETKAHSEILSKLYSENTNLNLRQVDSTKTYKTILRTIDSLKNGELDGIICVDMLGEGFDFPNLKIAAIHSPKKSLANTIQFIGRFARTNAKNIGEAKFIAIPNDIEIGKKKLYKEGAIWNTIIKNLNRDIISAEDEIKSVSDTFEINISKLTNEKISFYNLNPYCHVKVYKADGINFDSTFDFRGQKIIFHSKSREYNAIIFITKESEKPKWIVSDNLENVNYYFYLLFFDKKTKLLFINSSIKTYQFYDAIVKTFAFGNYERIPKHQINKVLIDISETKFYNIGMQNRSVSSGESYQTIAGPNAQQAIRKSHRKNYANGHAFMGGKADGENITIGYSTGSKIWSNSYQKIPEYIKWCKKLGEKIICTREVITNTGFDNLQSGESVNTFPLTAHTATWNSNTFHETPFLLTFDGDNIISKQQLLDYAIELDTMNSDLNHLELELIYDKVTIGIMYDFKNFYQYKSTPILNYIVEINNHCVPLIDYLNDNPLQILLEDFAAIINNDYFAPPKTDDFQFNGDNITSYDWKSNNTDITKEFYKRSSYKKRNKNKNSIHESLLNKLKLENNQVLIYDHGTGEVADFIAIKEMNGKVAITLYHVKGSSGNKPNDRVGDIYEVCMQVIKSQAWVANKQTFTNKILSRVISRPEKFIIGDKNIFINIINLNKKIEYSFAIVQPAISKATFSSKISYLLAATDDSIINSGYEPLIVIGS